MLLLLLFQIFEKAYLRNWTILRTIVLLIPFFKNSKKHTNESENTWDIVFAHTTFEIFKKAYLAISKYLEQCFSFIPCFKYLSKNTFEFQNTMDDFSAHTLFEEFKKAYLRISKIPVVMFLSNLFQIFKTAYLQTWKYLGKFVCWHGFWNI